MKTNEQGVCVTSSIPRHSGNIVRETARAGRYFMWDVPITDNALAFLTENLIFLASELFFQDAVLLFQNCNVSVFFTEKFQKLDEIHHIGAGHHAP